MLKLDQEDSSNIEEQRKGKRSSQWRRGFCEWSGTTHTRAVFDLTSDSSESQSCKTIYNEKTESFDTPQLCLQYVKNPVKVKNEVKCTDIWIHKNPGTDFSTVYSWVTYAFLGLESKHFAFIVFSLISMTFLVKCCSLWYVRSMKEESVCLVNSCIPASEKWLSHIIFSIHIY